MMQCKKLSNTLESGKGPVLVEAVSYRWFGHSASDAGKYRSREEVAEWKLKDLT